MSTYEPDMHEPEGEPPLAAEFVLGLVQGHERDELERRRRDDYVFAREVEFWEARLGPLADGLPPVDVSAHVWEKIAEDVGHKPVPLSASDASEKSGLWNSLAFWRGLGIATSALAAACLALLLRTPVEDPQPMLVATLQMDNGKTAGTVSLDRASGRIMLLPVSDMPQAPDQHTHELWLVPQSGQPRSLGTFIPKGPVSIAMPGDTMPEIGSEASLAVSVEPMGGSTAGHPTGSVVAHGKMQEL